MKKQFLAILLTLSIVSVYAQNMPKEGYTAVGFNITGLANIAIGNFNTSALSNAQIADPFGIVPIGYTVNDIVPQNMLFVKRYMTNGYAARLNLGINSISNKQSTVDSTGIPLEFQTTESKFSAFSLGLGIGAEKHVSTNSSKVDPYLGADIIMGFISKMKYSYVSDIVGDGYSTNLTIDDNIAGGFTAGLNLLGGFNYFFADNISIGSEVGIGFSFLKMGGDYDGTTSSSNTVGGTTTTSTSDVTGTLKNSSSGVHVGSYGGVNLSIYW